MFNISTKKKILVSVVCVIIFSSIGYVSINSFNKKDNLTYTSDAIYKKEYKDIFDVMENSEYVVIGQVLKAESYNDYSNKYKFKIDKFLKGNLESNQIDVYENKSLLKIDKKYILFLESYDSPLYQDIVYTSVVKECVVELDGDEYIENYFIDKKFEKSVDKLVKAIEKSDKVKVTKANKYVDSVQVEVIEDFKGDINTYKSIFLPSNTVEQNGEYLLFMKKLDEHTIELSSRKDSIISIDDKLFQNAIESFRN